MSTPSPLHTAWGTQLRDPEPTALFNSPYMAQLNNILSSTQVDSFGATPASQLEVLLSSLPGEIRDTVYGHSDPTELIIRAQADPALAGSLKAIVEDRLSMCVSSDTYSSQPGAELLISLKKPGGMGTQGELMSACLAYTYILNLATQSGVEGTKWVTDGYPSHDTTTFGLIDAAEKHPMSPWNLSALDLKALHIAMRQNDGARTQSSTGSGMNPHLGILKSVTDRMEVPVVSVTADQGAFDAFYSSFPVLCESAGPYGSRRHRVRTLFNQERSGAELKATSEREFERMYAGGGVEHLVTEIDRENNSSFKYKTDGTPSEAFRLLVENLAAITIRANNYKTHHTIAGFDHLDKAALGVAPGMSNAEFGALLEEEVRDRVEESRADYYPNIIRGSSREQPTSLTLLTHAEADERKLLIKHYQREKSVEAALAA